MTNKFKAVEIFNSLLSTEVTGKRYKEDKSFKEEDLKSVKHLIKEIGKAVNDDSIFNPTAIMKDLSNNRTKYVVDKVVELAVDSLTLPIMETVNFDNVLKDRSDSFTVKSTFESEVRSIVEKSIIDKAFMLTEEKSERERDVDMITSIYNTINMNSEFYKFTPQQLLIEAEDYTLLNELSPKEIISYMETNCYITYDEIVAS